MLEQCVDRLMQVFSIEYLFTVIFATYFFIRFLEKIWGKTPIPTWVKKVSSLGVGVVAFIVFAFITDLPKETLIVTYFAAVFMYDYAIKWLLEKFNANYKK